MPGAAQEFPGNRWRTNQLPFAMVAKMLKKLYTSWYFKWPLSNLETLETRLFTASNQESLVGWGFSLAHIMLLPPQSLNRDEDILSSDDAA